MDGIDDMSGARVCVCPVALRLQPEDLERFSSRSRQAVVHAG